MSIQNANVSRPRRVSRSPIPVSIDLTVTPPGSVIPGQINPGELVYLTANGAAASLNTAGAANANAAQAIGVAQGQYPALIADGIALTIPPGDANVPTVSIFEDGDHVFLTTAGDTYKPYDVVYLGANARTITKVASGTTIGYVSPDQRTANAPFFSAPGVVGGAGVEVYIRIKPALAK